LNLLTDVIIPQVQSILEAVAGVGANVHPYVRIAAHDKAFNDLFLDTAAGRIHGYTITREKTDVIEIDIGAARDMHTIVIRGYMGAKDADATETLMQNEVEAIRVAFMAKRKLQDGGGNPKVFWCDRITVRNFAYALFSGLLCHYAELVLIVHDYPIS
jgi:hypothetical protein